MSNKMAGNESAALPLAGSKPAVLLLYESPIFKGWGELTHLPRTPPCQVEMAGLARIELATTGRQPVIITT